MPEFGGQASVEERGVSKYVVGAPELDVEIGFTTQAFDLDETFKAYESAGVQESLVILIEEREVRWFRRIEGQFSLVATDPDGLFRSSVFPGLWLDPKALLERDAARLVATVLQGTETPEHAAFVARLAEVRTTSSQPEVQE